MELDSNHVNSRCATATWLEEEIAAHSDSCAVEVLLLQAIIYTDLCVCDVAFTVVWNVLVADKINGVGTFADSWDALSESSGFLCLEFAPQFFVLGVH
jgi:hypothetical protein